MTKELLIATRNQGKLREIRELLRGYPLRVTSLADYSGVPDVVEDGTTFRQNAVKKALTIARHTGKLCLGEDSGLEVRALGWRPGVYSARYSGPGATDQKNNAKLLRELKAVPEGERQARYRCCMALANREGVITVVDGRCSGWIATALRGGHGFGYDPLFLIARYKKTFGELDPAIKAGMSHRARALKKMIRFLQDGTFAAVPD